jgi:uncharacterized protein
VTFGQECLLLLAGVAAGLVGFVAGLASLVSYPVLLALGVPPLTANMTNTVAIVGSGVGSTFGAQLELVGQRSRVVALVAPAVAGGASGAALLLLLPSGAFENVVPFLVALASLALLLRTRLLAFAGHHLPERGLRVTALVYAVCIYGGYFGAAAGVMLLALFLAVTGERMAVSNALKGVILGIANAVAAVAFIVFGSVSWAAALPLAVGFLAGGYAGPVVFRRLPAEPVRISVAVAGFALAVKLGWNAFG